MLVSVFCYCVEFVYGIEYICFEVLMAVCGPLAGEGQASDAADVTGECWGLGVAPDGGWHLLEKCFTNGLGNGLGDECF